ncbi:MAG TPA: methyltransferase domain-containing protein [Gemmatimonadales bacterium]|nr:methyltransferase domain-containing protein [Gemmatimonadales bacterium]
MSAPVNPPPPPRGISLYNRFRRWLILSVASSDRRSGSVASKFRLRRWQLIKEVLALRGTETVLDVGGTDKSWWFVDWGGPVTRCNLSKNAASKGLRVVGDGRSLPFRDRQFDVTFSNSVIEHINTVEGQTLFARELERTGRRFFLQTPNKWFPIEPHYLFPCFQFLPVPVQRWLHTHFHIGTFRKWDPFGTIRLMSRRELRRLFPTARILPERLGPFVKSWYVVSAEDGPEPGRWPEGKGL